RGPGPCTRFAPMTLRGAQTRWRLLAPATLLLALVAWLGGLAPGEAQHHGTEALAARIADALRQADLGDRVGVSVVDARTGRDIFNLRGDLALNPASNMKVVTAAGAL